MSCRVLFGVPVCLILIFNGIASAADTPALPAVAGWRCGELKSVQLDTVSGNRGYWQERDYRTPDGVSLKATLTFGTGPKFYNQPPDGTISDGEFPGLGASYEIISLAGFRALVEKDSMSGYSVAVNAFERKFTLTVECGRFEDRDDVISRAEALMALI
ncbi:MAG: hypothetical protein LBS53_08795 [Synergistaceae bacterium]|jgi:hypothetical protein|nr:hypothetical protein [Synergistaceae bacterium]